MGRVRARSSHKFNNQSQIMPFGRSALLTLRWVMCQMAILKSKEVSEYVLLNCGKASCEMRVAAGAPK